MKIKKIIGCMLVIVGIITAIWGIFACTPICDLPGRPCQYSYNCLFCCITLGIAFIIIGIYLIKSKQIQRKIVRRPQNHKILMAPKIRRFSRKPEVSSR